MYIHLHLLGSMSVPPPPLPRGSPPPFEFTGKPLSEHSLQIYSIISDLKTNLTPRELYTELNQLRIPLMIDVNDLGHAYYGYYWKQGSVASQAQQGSVANQAQQGSKDQIIARIRANKAQQGSVASQAQLGSKDQIIARIRANQANKIKEPFQVPNATAHGDEHHDRVCNVNYAPNNYLMSPDVFAEALRTISPREITSSYYHHRLICHNNFNDFLTHMNQTLKTYFVTPAYAVGPPMNQLLNGIIKCICLRVLSRSAYHYAYIATHELNDNAMKHLLAFYRMTNLIHAWDENSFDQHEKIIHKYDVFKGFITELLNLPYWRLPFLSTHYFTFREVTNDLELVLFDNLYGELAYFTCARFPHCITELKRDISSQDILHSMELQTGVFPHNPEAIVTAGLILLQFLVNRITQDNALSRNTIADYNVARNVLKLTHEHLSDATHPHEYALFNEFVRIVMTPQFTNSETAPPPPPRMDSSPFQALHISHHMFRADRNTPRAYLHPVNMARSHKRKRQHSGGAKSNRSAKRSIRKSKTRKIQI
jgi:hypothetical protein